MALRLGLEYCRDHNFFPLILEIDSLDMKNIKDGDWEVPWGIAMEIKWIQECMTGEKVVLKHTYGECNKVANFTANQLFSFVGTERLTYSNVLKLPKETRVVLNMDKHQAPNLRLKKFKMGSIIMVVEYEVKIQS